MKMMWGCMAIIALALILAAAGANAAILLPAVGCLAMMGAMMWMMGGMGRGSRGGDDR